MSTVRSIPCAATADRRPGPADILRAIVPPNIAMIAWNADTYGVGIREIDDQHRVLVDLINRVDGALQSGAAKQVQRDLLDELIRFTEYHFFTEEHYMRRTGYPDEAPHREGHHHLVDALLQLKDDFTLRNKHDTRSLVDFLSSWLMDHIVHSDKELAAYLRSRGVE